MALITEKELKQQIKAGDFSPVYFIYGSEDYLKRHCVDFICQKAVEKDFADFNFHRIDGAKAELQDIFNAVEAVPMFSPRTCVLVQDFPVESYADELTSFLQDLPDTTVLVFWMLQQSFSVKKNSACKTLYSVLEKVGSVISCEKPSQGDLVSMVMKGAQKRGCKIEKPVAAYFVETVGGDLHHLLLELEKVCANADYQEIQKTHVDTVVIKSIEAKTFDMVRALLAGKSSQVFYLLKDLIAQRTAPMMLLGALISTYVDMYRAKVAVISGKRAEDCATIFQYRGQTFKLTNAARNASKLSFGQIRKCLDVLYWADTRMKSTAIDEQIILEECMIKLMLVANE